MEKLRLVYIWSFRNAAADLAGQPVPYKGQERLMMSPLHYLVDALNDTPLGQRYALVGVVNDDDPGSPRDVAKVGAYGSTRQPGQPWFYPQGLRLDGRPVDDLLLSVPSEYRRLPLGDERRVAAKQCFERALEETLVALRADVVLLDGLLVILHDTVLPGSRFAGRIYNIHPGITRLESPYCRRGAYATWDALYGARGLRVADWATGATAEAPQRLHTGASFHHVDTGIDSGEVVLDALNTSIAPDDTILELRWNNFTHSLLPLMVDGLLAVAARHAG